MKLGPVSLSWRRWLTQQPKRRISRATGVPLTRSGRNAKLGRMIGVKVHTPVHAVGSAEWRRTATCHP